ncbi:hypothetical protein [Aeromicrobium sp. Leaf291]|uniref:hypothetical protein n=1 Tax=Aeromicrobium sp. Leaf291 TaxID=1736325 RepID=UPI0006FB8921|nr:hypothetical protein [Aeromicrobium sp. Leaf291]KQP81634.1 hypothetical protein ASF35_16520 [Aeromicrobium sp. Leaf291]
MRRFALPLVPGAQPGHWRAAELVLAAPELSRSVPHSVDYVDADGVTRLEHGGPMVPGPIALMTPCPYGLLTKRPLRLIDGDVLVLGSLEYRVDAYVGRVDLYRLT